MMQFISGNPVLAIFLCLGLGYLVGGIRIKSFSIGPTVGTLIVAFIISMMTDIEIPGIVVSIFSILFCFTIGYEAGPALFGSLKSSGLKFVIHSVFFCVVSLGTVWGVSYFMRYSRDVAVGMAAGALTQTSILSVVENLGANASMTYALTYLGGMLLNVLFNSKIAPHMLGTTAQDAVKRKIDSEPEAVASRGRSASFSPVNLRAYIVDDQTAFINKTVKALEEEYDDKIQIERIYRGGEPVSFDQETVIAAQDVLGVIGKMKYLVAFENQYELSESSDAEFFTIDIRSETVIVTKAYEGDLMGFLSDHGIVVQALFRNGKRLHRSDGNIIQKGDHVRLSGTEKDLNIVAHEIGYIKDTGAATDISFLFLAAAIGIAVGTVKIFGIPLGESTMALIIGLIVGWYYNKNPRFGRFPSSARWILKSVGLNLFIAAKALTTTGISFNASTLSCIGIGAVVTLIPLILTLFFGKYILRLEDADNLGGQCGSSTCTASLNALTDATDSSVFSASYATTNAISNILLTVVGVIVSLLIH